jgi:sialic acid synthase SpsE
MTKIVAEIGSNWTPGNLDSALAMVRLAAECGADLVKFQDWYPLEDFNRPQWWKEKYGQKWELSPSWLNALATEALRLGIDFFTSVFTESAIGRIGMSGPVKVASGEIGNQELLLEINERLSPRHRVYLSVPHNRQGALIFASAWLRSCDVTLLHCVTEYPADDAHLEQLRYLREFGLPVGFSSHLPYPQVIEAVRQMGDLAVLELHLRSRETPADCPDNGEWALYPDQFKEVVEVIRG